MFGAQVGANIGAGIGGGTGTLVAPGPGTLGGGISGAVGGGIGGAVLGGLGGALAGSIIEDGLTELFTKGREWLDDDADEKEAPQKKRDRPGSEDNEHDKKQFEDALRESAKRCGVAGFSKNKGEKPMMLYKTIPVIHLRIL